MVEEEATVVEVDMTREATVVEDHTEVDVVVEEVDVEEEAMEDTRSSQPCSRLLTHFTYVHKPLPGLLDLTMCTRLQTCGLVYAYQSEFETSVGACLPC